MFVLQDWHEVKGRGVIRVGGVVAGQELRASVFLIVPFRSLYLVKSPVFHDVGFLYSLWLRDQLPVYSAS